MNVTWRDQAGAVWKWAIGVFSGFVDRVVETILSSVVRRSRGEPRQTPRVRTLQSLLRSVVRYVLIVVVSVTVLDACGFHLSAVLAGAGVVGMAVGFGAQRLVRDVISGFFILAEDQYSVGDRISVGAVSGTVAEVGMRITRLRDDDGKLVILSNGDISSVTNYSRGPLLCSVDVSLPSDTDLDRLAQTLQGLDLDLERGPILEQPGVQGISSLDGTAMTVRVAARARPGRHGEAELLLRQKIHQALSAAGSTSGTARAGLPPVGETIC